MSCSWSTLEAVKGHDTYIKDHLPSGRNIVSERRTWANLPGEAQVANFDDIIVDQQVFWLHVAVEESVFVHGSESAGDLEDYIPESMVRLLDFLLSEAFTFFFHFGVDLVKIVVKVLEYHVKFFGHEEYFFELDDAGVIQFTKGLNFSKFDALVPAGVFLLHFFDGDYFSCLDVGGFVDCPEGPVP